MIQNVNEICEIIERYDFSEEGRNNSVARFKKNGWNDWVYVRLKGTVPTVVLHPKHESILTDLRKIEGANYIHGNDTRWIHSPNLREFPKRQNKGQGLIHYGIAFNFDSVRSLQLFMARVVESVDSKFMVEEIEDVSEEILTYEESRELLDDFLRRWPIEALNSMSLEEYVGVKNADTFCQWVETGTRSLGSIKGGSSIKFGIYERADSLKKLTQYKNDGKFTWSQRYGNDRSEVFENVKREVIEIAKYAEKGHFWAVDKVGLSTMFKWKIAFLYSNERLIPIYKREVLDKIVQYYNSSADKRIPISEIQQILISNKPAGLDVYSFMRKLYAEFGSDEVHAIHERKHDRAKRKSSPKRKPASSRNTKPARRSVNYSATVNNRHNRLQLALRNELVKKFDADSVVMEENFVDVKLIQPGFLGFYEVKSAAYASDCVKHALGQVLLYAHNDEDPRTKKIYVVGQYPANKKDKEYIEYLKERLDLEFEYIHVDL